MELTTEDQRSYMVHFRLFSKKWNIAETAFIGHGRRPCEPVGLGDHQSNHHQLFWM